MFGSAEAALPRELLRTETSSPASRRCARISTCVAESSAQRLLAGLRVALVGAVDFQQAVEQELGIDAALGRAQVAFDHPALGGDRGELHRVQPLARAAARLQRGVEADEHQRPAGGNAEA